MRIGELADAAGMTAKALRFYEARGLLPPPARTASGYRDYDPDTLERLAFVRDAQLAGLTLAEIASVLDMKDMGTGTCEHTASLLRRHLDDVDGRIAALSETRRRLRDLADRAAGLDPTDCRDPHRCQVIAAGRSTRSAAIAESGVADMASCSESVTVDGANPRGEGRPGFTPQIQRPVA